MHVVNCKEKALYSVVISCVRCHFPLIYFAHKICLIQNNDFT